MVKKVKTFKTPKKSRASPVKRRKTKGETINQESEKENSRKIRGFKNADEYMQRVIEEEKEKSVVDFGAVKTDTEEPNNAADINHWDVTGVKPQQETKPSKTKSKKTGTKQKKQTIRDNHLNESKIHKNNRQYELCDNCTRLDVVQNGLVVVLQAENEMLREHLANASNINLYRDMLGIDIKQEKDRYLWTVQRKGSAGLIELTFELKEANKNSYSVKLVDSSNCTVPEFMYDGIEFEKRSFMLFFYKIMQCVCENKVNK